MSQTHRIGIRTEKRDQMVEVTDQVCDLVHTAPTPHGHVIVYVPHTTAGVTINENADPDVLHDVLQQLDVMVPHVQPFYRHAEGNSAAHVKAIMTGSSVTVVFAEHRLLLGRWQGLFFCEFDGPREREVLVHVTTH